MALKSSNKIDAMLKDISILKEIIIADIEVIEPKDYILIFNRISALLVSLKKNKSKVKIAKSKIGKDYSTITTSLMYRKLNDGDVISLYADDQNMIDQDGRVLKLVIRVIVRYDKRSDAFIGIMNGKFYYAASDVYVLLKEALPNKKNKVSSGSARQSRLKLKLL